MNIIDGVDVSGCEYWKGYCRIASLCDYSGHLCEVTSNCYYKQLKRKEQECEQLKKQLMQKSEVDMFFNTPLEGWSSDPCGICPHKAENEDLKKYKEVVDKLAGKQVILTNENGVPQLYDNAKDLKLKQLSKALTEIKEIAQYDVYTPHTDLCIKLNWVKKKICECEVKDE